MQHKIEHHKKARTCSTPLLCKCICACLRYDKQYKIIVYVFNVHVHPLVRNNVNDFSRDMITVNIHAVVWY